MATTSSSSSRVNRIYFEVPFGALGPRISRLGSKNIIIRQDSEETLLNSEITEANALVNINS